MLVVVTYDISDEKRLTRAAKIIKNFGWRVQKSVYECHLDPSQYTKLKRKVGAVIDKDTDRIRFYTVCKDDINYDLHIGDSKIYKDEDYYVI